MNIKKVLFITESPVFCGTDTFALNLAKEFKSNNIDVEFLINKNHSGYKKYKQIGDVSFFKYLSLHDLSQRYKIIYKIFILFLYPIYVYLNVLTILQQIKRKSPTLIIVVNGGWPGGCQTYASMISAGLSKIPTLYTIHNYVLYRKRYMLYNLIIEKIVSSFDNIIYSSVSYDCAADIVKKSFLRKEIYIVYNGVDDNNTINYSPTYDREFNIVWVGNFIEYKGVDLLIKAVKALSSKYNFINLYLYGNILDNFYYLQIKNSISNDQNIKIVLNEYDKEAIYKDKHLVVMPSIAYESFGLVLVEGMSFGLPVIASNIMGMKEIIYIDQDLEFGFTFNVNDVYDLEKKIELVLMDKERYKVLSKNARIAYKKYFTIEKMYKSYLELIKEMGINVV